MFQIIFGVLLYCSSTHLVGNNNKELLKILQEQAREARMDLKIVCAQQKLQSKDTTEYREALCDLEQEVSEQGNIRQQEIALDEALKYLSRYSDLTSACNHFLILIRVSILFLMYLSATKRSMQKCFHI